MTAYLVRGVHAGALGQEARNCDGVITEYSFCDVAALRLLRDAKSLAECCKGIGHTDVFVALDQ